MKVFNNRNCGKNVESHNTYKQCLILVQVGAEVDVFSKKLHKKIMYPYLPKERNFAVLLVSTII